MGESSSFNSRAAALLNKPMFSDVEIQVKDGNNHKTFNAHKLFLAMSSPEFASIFYGKFESPKFIKIFDYKPHTVYMMLQYVYSDSCDVATIEEAKHLYSLAKKYRIADLERYCLTYLSKEEITLDNLFEKYEFALSENIGPTLEECRDLVSVEAPTVLASPHFAAAPLPVVEDILKLDTLNVESELIVVTSAVEWARQECLRRGSYTENLRICLYPLFKHLRFLALTPEEFCGFVEKNENILNSHESTMLTMSLLMPSSDCRLPSGFSSNSSPRALPPEKGDSKSDDAGRSLENVLKSQLSFGRGEPLLPAAECSEPRHKPSKKQFPVMKVSPQVTLMNQRRVFEFPLKELGRTVTSAFASDIKCSALIHLLRGGMQIYGIELKIQEKERENDIKAFLSVVGPDPPLSRVYEDQVKNGLLSMEFHEPLTLTQNSQVKIEVLVEDLVLNRCYGYFKDKCEFNCGLNLRAEITMKSNQFDEERGYFFLMSRLLYRPC